MLFSPSRVLVGTGFGRPMLEAARVMTECLAVGGKLLICGNGGSAADAWHIAAEFVSRISCVPGSWRSP